MAGGEDRDQYSSEETERRLRKTLSAAFNMRPTQLKDIPKKRAKKRAEQPKKPRT
jgi:hypothetical protein